MEFEWDPVKASRNVEKHAVDFDTAAEIFDDPNVFVVIDSRTYGERRYQAIGASRGVNLFVVHTIAAITFAGLSAPGERAIVREQLIRYRPGRDPKSESTDRLGSAKSDVG